MVIAQGTRYFPVFYSQNIFRTTAQIRNGEESQKSCINGEKLDAHLCLFGVRFFVVIGYLYSLSHFSSFKQQLGFDLPFDREMTDSSEDEEHDEYLYHYGTQQQRQPQDQQQQMLPSDLGYSSGGLYIHGNNNGTTESGSDVPSDEEDDDEEEGEKQQQLPSSLQRVSKRHNILPFFSS